MSWVKLDVDLNEKDEPLVNKDVQGISCLRWDHADLSVYSTVNKLESTLLQFGIVLIQITRQ